MEDNVIEIVDNIKEKKPTDRKAYFVEYHKKHKDRISELNKRKITCDLCNKKISASNFSKHRKTSLCKKKHIQLTGKDEMQELREEVEKLKQMIAKK